MARVVLGPEYNPSTHDLDGEVVMRAGGGKKHGRFWIGEWHNRHGQYSNSLLDSSKEHQF